MPSVPLTEFRYLQILPLEDGKALVIETSSDSLCIGIDVPASVLLKNLTILVRFLIKYLLIKTLEI